MDSLTHIALGACLGEAFLGKQLGRRAMVWGALAHSSADIDFIAGFWLSPSEALLAHRGFTHSLLFAAVLSFVYAITADRYHRPHNISMKTWGLFFSVAIFGHVFIDAFNNYGVGWFEPFSHYRISFNSLYVADPFFSLWPALALAGLLFFKSKDRQRRRWLFIGLGLPLLYLGYALCNKAFIIGKVRSLALQEHIPYTDYFSTPAPLNNWLWFFVLKADTGYYTGYRSVWDGKKPLTLTYFPQNRHLLDTVSDHEAVQHLIRFSRNFYTVEQWHDTLVFNNLQFGQMLGWVQPRGHFVFHFYLSHPNDNRLVVQRGRFEGWNREAFWSLIRRIRGNAP